MNMSNLQSDLKEKTKQAHRDAEGHSLMQSFINGSFKKEHLLQFLCNMLPIYQAVEQRLLQPYYDNTDLFRSNLIEKDIVRLVVTMGEDKVDPKLLTPLDCTDLWLGWMWTKPKGLLKAEFYSRWLADFYGGRMMAPKLKPFDNMYSAQDSKSAIQKVREILDINIDDTADSDVVDEVIGFFDFHLTLFNSIFNDE